MRLRRRRNHGDAGVHDRISISVLDPPCPCRTPLTDPAVRQRRAVTLELRGHYLPDPTGTVLRAVDGLEDDACLKVAARAVSWPLLHAITAAGHRFQIVRRDEHGVEFFVWRFLSPDERRRYLHGAMKDVEERVIRVA